jgi:hypothetical protein
VSTTISDEEVKEILDAYWEEIACFAYEHYHIKGKGVVGLEKTCKEKGSLDSQVQLLYAIYDYEAGKPDRDAARLIREYDPMWEVVIQYIREDGSVRTMRIRTSPGARHPWRIWIFDKLINEDEIEKGGF